MEKGFYLWHAVHWWRTYFTSTRICSQ
jgi:hypothetical protein